MAHTALTIQLASSKKIYYSIDARVAPQIQKDSQIDAHLLQKPSI
jgi:hypothetical protein